MASRRSAAGAVPWILLVVDGALIITFLVVDRQPPEPLLITAAVGFSVVGSLILHRVPGNRVGWVCSLIGLAFVISGNGAALGDRGFVVGEALSGMMWMSWFVLGGFLLLWYPTGRIPSARWRVVQWVGVVAELEAVSYLLARDVCVAGQSEGSCAVFQRNPIGIDFVPNPEFSSSGDLGFLVVLGFILASVVALGVRYRRARGVERLQLKGLVFACLLLVAVVVVQETVPGLPVWLDNTVFGLGVLALPTAIGVSILRYRLYGIERVISRTFGYGIVAAVVVAVYLVLATLVPTELIGQRSPAFVAGATLAAATIFNPVRRRVLRSVDRRFYRSRYDAELEIAAFAGHLTERLDVDSLAADWLEVVARTMHPQSASVWVQERGVAARTR